MADRKPRPPDSRRHDPKPEPAARESAWNRVITRVPRALDDGMMTLNGAPVSFAARWNLVALQLVTAAKAKDLRTRLRNAARALRMIDLDALAEPEGAEPMITDPDSPSSVAAFTEALRDLRRAVERARAALPPSVAPARALDEVDAAPTLKRLPSALCGLLEAHGFTPTGRALDDFVTALGFEKPPRDGVDAEARRKRWDEARKRAAQRTGTKRPRK